MKNKILITIDVEECDVPMEYGYDLSLEEQLELSRKGLANFMEVVEQEEIPITIFCTGVYAENNPEWIKQLHKKHELASHGFFHGKFDAKTDLLSSKLLLENLSGKQVLGFRMARMQYVDELEIKKAGYQFHSSLNPTWIPGRYNHLKSPKLPFFEHDLWNVPASVSPNLRIPLFWLSFKNFPLGVYKKLVKDTLKEHGFLNIYFHPWEFTDLSKYPLPNHVKKGSKGELLKKLSDLLKWLKKENLGDFTTMADYVKTLSNESK
ncbi:polysaccharide deacetylase family protein [Aquirufa sp. ROCK-SH2]